MVAVPNPLALAALYGATAVLVALAVPILAGLCALVAIEWGCDALRALDAALALWLSEPRGVDERGAW